MKYETAFFRFFLYTIYSEIEGYVRRTVPFYLEEFSILPNIFLNGIVVMVGTVRANSLRS